MEIQSGLSICVCFSVRVCADVFNTDKMAVAMHAHMLVLDVDKDSSGSKQKFCPNSIFSMSVG